MCSVEAPVEDTHHVPLASEKQLLPMQDTIPGHPSIPLDDGASVRTFLIKELSTERLKRLYRILFLVSNRNNISPLHHQLIKRRTIYITERPDLHLVWHCTRIFIKPVPKYLLSYEFRTTTVYKALDGNGNRLSLDAVGFLRSYSQLIVHESDFMLAKELKLLPGDVTWPGWCHFIKGFCSLRDGSVAPRYHYGEIRLTRLNFWHILLYGSSYASVNHNYATFFAKFGAPYLFIFGAATVVLSALQTGLQAFPDHGTYHGLAAKFVPISLISTAVGLCILPLLFLWFWVKELVGFLVYYRPLT